jgi:hypothetical protein
MEPPAEAVSVGADVVMVPSDKDSMPPPSVGDLDVVMSSAPEPSPTMGAPEPSSAAGAASVGEAMGLAVCLYVDFPGIGIIDLGAPELLSNDWEMLEVETERMFTEPSILETIASVVSALCQYEGAGGSAPPAASEAAEAVPKESATSAESAAVVPAPPPTKEGQKASLPQPAEAAASASTATAAGAAVGVVGEVGPSSPRPIVDEVLMLGEPAVAPHEHVASKSMTRVASPEILEAEEDTSAALLQGAANGEAQTLELACAHGRPPSRLATTPRTMRRWRRATL